MAESELRRALADAANDGMPFGISHEQALELASEAAHAMRTALAAEGRMQPSPWGTQAVRNPQDLTQTAVEATELLGRCSAWLMDGREADGSDAEVSLMMEGAAGAISLLGVGLLFLEALPYPYELVRHIAVADRKRARQ